MKKQKPNFPPGFSAQNATSKNIPNCNLNELFVSYKFKQRKKKNSRYHYIFNHFKGAFENPKKGPKSFRFKNMKKVWTNSWTNLESKANSKTIVLFFTFLKIDV